MSFRRIFAVAVFLLSISSKPLAQVTLPTGSAVFSLPIFDWQDNKSRLKTVVALSYSSGNGLKVDNVASNVGQGWSLVQGGVMRTKRNKMDDQKADRSGNFPANGDQDITKYPNGYLYRSRNPPMAVRKLYPIILHTGSGKTR